MVVFIHYGSSDKTVKEAIFDLVPLKRVTRDDNIKNSVDRTLRNTAVPRNKLVSVATDEALEMIGRNLGLITLMKNDPSFTAFLSLHYSGTPNIGHFVNTVIFAS